MSSTKRIISEEKKIEHEEAKILLEERKIENEEREVKAEEGKIVSIEKTIREATKMRLGFLRKFAKHKFIFSMIAGTGVVLVWRGLWDISETIPGLESSVVALIVGIGILWFLERYTEL